MSIAICIKCGTERKDWRRPCPSCGFEPRSEDEKVLSLVLSGKVFEAQFDVDIEGQNLPSDEQALRDIGVQIREGTPYQVDPLLKRAVAKQIRQAEQFRASLTWPRVVFLYVLPTILVLGVAIYAGIVIIFG